VLGLGREVNGMAKTTKKLSRILADAAKRCARLELEKSDPAELREQLKGTKLKFLEFVSDVCSNVPGLEYSTRPKLVLDALRAYVDAAENEKRRSQAHEIAIRKLIVELTPITAQIAVRLPIEELYLKALKYGPSSGIITTPEKRCSLPIRG
jgi:hypothetical protein